MCTKPSHHKPVCKHVFCGALRQGLQSPELQPHDVHGPVSWVLILRGDVWAPCFPRRREVTAQQ